MRTRTLSLLSASLAGVLLFVTPSTATLAPDSSTGSSLRFALMSGDQEVPPVDTDGRGLSLFLDFQDQFVVFAVLTRDLEEITQAHLHLAPAGQNGSIVAFLFDTDEPVTKDGLLSFGVLTDEDLVGPLEDGTIADLLQEMDAENIYVNVHTVGNPSGEIRGQVQRIDSSGL